MSQRDTATILDLIARGDQTHLTDAELLSVFLTRRKGRTPQDLAEALCRSLPRLDRLYVAERAGDYRAEGVAPSVVLKLLAADELATRRTMRRAESVDAITSPADVRRYLGQRLGHREHEVFAALWLDNRHRVIQYREHFDGTIDSAAVYPREIVKAAFRFNAAAVIFAYNHPSGVPEPSDTDVRLTRKLVDALALIDVRVVDHLIVGHGASTSMAERGLM